MALYTLMVVVVIVLVVKRQQGREVPTAATPQSTWDKQVRSCLNEGHQPHATSRTKLEGDQRQGWNRAGLVGGKSMLTQEKANLPLVWPIFHIQ